MSTLFNINIDSVVGTTVRARFEVCHPDQWEVPGSKNVALQTLVEVFDCLQRGFLHGADQPFRKREATNLINVHPRRSELQNWRELMWGKSVEINEEEFNQLQNSADRVKGISGYGSRDGTYHKTFEPEFAEFRKQAELAIAEVHLEDEVGNPKLEEDGADPKATLVFTVNNVDDLFHMVDGFYFGSAMFDITDAYCQ